jgi:hypothetical protein
LVKLFGHAISGGMGTGNSLYGAFIQSRLGDGAADRTQVA